MQQFSFKDFIKYNSPCKGCNGLPIILSSTSLIYPQSKENTNIKIDIKNEISSVKLKSTYNDNLFFHFNPISHKILTDVNLIAKYFSKHKLCFISSCNKCYSYIDSSIIEFDFNKNIFKPFMIESEIFNFTDGENKYKIISSYKKKKTKILVSNQFNLDMYKFTIDLFPVTSLDNKKELIKKIQTYILFS